MEEITQKVFSGTLENLPEKESTAVRIFLSSTFTDFQTERNWLMKNAVPKLRKFCLEKGLDFQIADMRWGVREDATDDHKTTELCLHEIKNCQRLSRGPNFVAFLGDKYGFRPLPSDIEATEFKLIKNTAMKLGHDTSTLLIWYLSDYNREPTMYSLQPISSLYPHYFDMTPANAQMRQQAQRDWWSTVEKLCSLLRQTSDHLYKEGKLSEEARHKYFQSVTENEVSVGVFRVKDIKKKVICFQRFLNDIDPTDYITGRFTDLSDGAIDLVAEKLREHLRRIKIPEVMSHDQIFQYNLLWDKYGINASENKEHARYIEQFGKDFTETLEKMITYEMTESMSQRYRTPLFEEILHHLHFCKTKCEHFCGREKLIDEIKGKLLVLFLSDQRRVNVRRVLANDDKSNKERMDAEQDERCEGLKKIGVKYVVGDKGLDLESDPNLNPKEKLEEMPTMLEYHRPVVISGKSGSGKTAVMAKIAQLSQQWFPGSVTMVRFLGTSAISTTIRQVLITACMQIWQVYKVQRPAGIEFEEDYQLLVRYFASLLWKINCSERPLVIILDSIDQLSPVDHAHMFNWLPHKLPANVHILISIVSDRTDCLKNVQQIFLFSEQYVQINDLEPNVASDILTLMCQKSQRHLSRKQKNMLLDQFTKCSQPLYLKLLIDMSLSWRSYTDVDQRLLGVSVSEAINHLFNSLEKTHGEQLVQKGIGYLCAARDGLSEAELEDLLSVDDEVLQDTYIYHLPPDPDVIRLPPLLWKRVLYDIREYIVERQSGGKTVIGWYHRQFVEAATRRYLPDASRRPLHTVLAQYFQGLWSDKCKPLQLTKGKKGMYPKAMRQVPSQPIKFGPNVYNVRKLNELPYHLIQSQQFESALTELFSDPDWLYAKCLTLTLTSVMEDFRLAEEHCGKFIVQKRGELAGQERRGQKKDGGEVRRLENEVKVFEGIKLVARMVLLAADSIRKDPVNLPLVLLSQFGADYKGIKYIEQLVLRCQKWCENFTSPLLVPIRECMSKPSSNQLYTISVEMELAGEKRGPYYRGSFINGEQNKLFVVQQNSSNKPDQLHVFDLHDNGSCITMETIEDGFVKCARPVAGSRYMLFEVYTNKECPNPYYRLYESSMATPVMPDCRLMELIAVSESGKYVAWANCKAFSIYKMDKTHERYHSFAENDFIIVILISPDASYVVTSSEEPNKQYWKKGMADSSTSALYDVESKTKLCDLPSFISIQKTSIITKTNLLVCKKKIEMHAGLITVIVYCLATGEIRHEIPNLFLEWSHEYVLKYFQSTPMIIGTQKENAALLDVEKGVLVGKAPPTCKGPYYSVAVFGEDILHYAVCRWQQLDVTLLYAGPVDKPLEEAVVIYVLIGHNLPIREIHVQSSLDLLITASLDNTVKVWDLKHILSTFSTDLCKMEKMAQQTALQNGLIGADSTDPLDDLLSKYKPNIPDVKSQTTKLALNRSGDHVYVGTEDSKLQVYDVDTGKHKLTIDHDAGPVTMVILSRDGRYVMAAGKTKIHVEDLHSENRLCLEARGQISCMAEANSVLVAGFAGMAAKGRTWNIQTGEIILDFELLYSFYSVAINSTGTKVVSSMFEYPVIVHLYSQRHMSINNNTVDTVMSSGICCTISPDDKLAAMSSTDGSVRVIDMDGKYKFRFQQKSSAVNLAFSKESTTLLSAGYRSIYVWSITDGSCRYKLTRHLDFLNEMKFDETGRYLVTISRDKQLILWDFSRGVSIATFQTNCQVQAVDISSAAACIVYIPEGIADLAVLKPNKALRDKIGGKVKPLTLTPQVQAVMFAFSGQKSGFTSQACTVM